MSFWTADHLRAACGGRWIQRPEPGVTIAGVGIDTRTGLRDRAFVAVRGETHDGHDFLGPAVAAGARVLVVDHHRTEVDLAPYVGVIQVDETRAALGRLATAYRKTLANTMVSAITGSAGKTTVKTLLDAVLSTTRTGRCAVKSFNNDIGVPLTILGADPQDEYLIVEIGANGPGEIDQLAAIARPDVGVITMVGRGHLAGFGSTATIANEKAALLRHLVGDRRAVVNADAALLRAHLSPLPQVVLFGEAADANVRLTGWGKGGTEDGGWWLEVNGSRRFGLGLPGRHNAFNALAAVAVGRLLGIDDRLIDSGLRTCRPVDMRMTRHDLDGVTIYNDAYNANPDSMIASLETFATLAADAARRILVLGDMLELGDAAPDLHREIGHRVHELDQSNPVDRVVLVGPLAAHIADALEGDRYKGHLTRLDDLGPDNAAALAATLKAGDTVLLKGSRAIGLERLVEAMTKAAGAGQSVPQLAEP
jgi:UDP-N-acetylmuramoyl-tripeptide--D-alanyl-D-alanine ligase